jgi:hypothetical protein
LRRRGKKLIENANNIPEKDWIKVDLKKEKRKFNKFKMYESEITLPRTNLKVRQVIFKDHGRQVPTFLVTNNRDVELETLALHYANRWLIENKFVSSPNLLAIPKINKCISTNLPIYYSILLVLETITYQFPNHYLDNQIQNTFLSQSILREKAF